MSGLTNGATRGYITAGTPNQTEYGTVRNYIAIELPNKPELHEQITTKQTFSRGRVTNGHRGQTPVKRKQLQGSLARTFEIEWQKISDLQGE